MPTSAVLTPPILPNPRFFTDADNFTVDFPQNASGQQRMLLLGALFLIDFLYFEKTSNDSHNNAFGF